MEKGLGVLYSKQVAIEWLRFQLLENGKSYKDMAKVMKVTKQAVRGYCITYDINISKRTARWYAKRLGAPVLENAVWIMEQKREGQIGINRLAKRLGFSRETLREQIIRLGLDPEDFQDKPKRSKKPRITMLCMNCGRPVTRRIDQIEGKRFIFCSQSCRSSWLGREYGFGRKPVSNKAMWGPEQDKFIRANWEEMSDEEMASKLGFTEGIVAHYRRSLKLFHKSGRRPKK
jgi:transcriptional regulator with XRE-family HTH domain